MVTELSNQTGKIIEFEAQIGLFRSILDEQKTVWDRLSKKQKQTWIKDQKDPVMVLAHRVHVYLDDYFGGFDG
ncbi:MAG: hypothetical protein MI862_12445 [Desulfobacterales bacterium]|nr:hypothetical protein [Desulfobacterales bacterium]